MKTIAAVTMSFLPGTFVASFFAMPLFEWDSDNGRVVNPQIWIYWAVAIPLTALSFAVWWIWLHYLDKHDEVAEMGLPDNAYLGESGVSNPAESRQAHL